MRSMGHSKQSAYLVEVFFFPRPSKVSEIILEEKYGLTLVVSDVFHTILDHRSESRSVFKVLTEPGTCFQRFVIFFKKYTRKG